LQPIHHFVEHTRACEICGKPYKVGGGRGLWNKLTCGPACAREKNRRNQKAWMRAHPGSRSIRLTGDQRVCEICGKEFTVTHTSAWNRKVCSAACRAELRRRNMKVWIRSQQDFYRERYWRKKAPATGKEPRRFGPGLRQGFCLGCGGKTRHVPAGKQRSAKDKDTLQWHRSCRQLFVYRWTKGLFTGLGEERACSVCGRKFLSRRFGGFIQKACSEKCRTQQRLQSMKAWRKRHAKQLEAWREANRDRINARNRARRKRRK